MDAGSKPWGTFDIEESDWKKLSNEAINSLLILRHRLDIDVEKSKVGKKRLRGLRKHRRGGDQVRPKEAVG